MATLNFEGPFHFSTLDSKNKNYKNLTKTAGIYIWGFAYDTIRENGKLTLDRAHKFESDFQGKFDKDWKFIPYYVGLANNTPSMNMYKRLTDHQNVREYEHAKKYLRLESDYYKRFFSEIDFPIHTSGKMQLNGINKLIGNSINSNAPIPISYFNNVAILQMINSNIIVKKALGAQMTMNQIQNIASKYAHFVEIKDIPITECFYPGGNNIDDTLYELVDNKEKKHLNNFWFCYSELQIADETHEAQTFYSLKGKTISKTLDYNNSIKNNKFNHDIFASPSCKDIFVLDPSAPNKAKHHDKNSFTTY